MKVINFFLLSLLLILFSSCSTVKKGFESQRKNSTDEFLVEKKRPLVLPPVYGKLPTPDDAIKNSEKNKEFKEVISSSKNNSNKKTTDNKSSSLQESILDKIK